jgi:outer membrane biosynthesis protein TonB
MEMGGRGGRTRDARRERMWLAAGGSVFAHALIVLGLVLAEGAFGHRPPQDPRMRVYAVNIVSPPPTLRGPPPAEAPAPNVGGRTPPAAAPIAAPRPAPAAAPAPPAPSPPKPTPEPPKPEPRPAPAPPKEPARTPEPRTPPRPPSTPARPATTPARPATAPARPTSTTGTRPTTTTPKPNTAAPTERRPGASNGPGSGAASAGTGTRGAPTGRNPDPNSAGGEGLNLQQRGAECPSAGYCENIVRQVRRWFRRPEGSTGTAEACFTILRDGTVDDIVVNRVRGGFPFRMAVTEAVEQAGLHRAFGALPRAFDAAELPVCVDITPQT